MTATPAIAAAPTEEWRHLFGICARLGEDFGFDPLWLRIAFGATLVLAPVQVILAYFALGLVVLASRMLFPVQRPAPARIAPRTEQPKLPLAA